MIPMAEPNEHEDFLNALTTIYLSKSHPKQQVTLGIIKKIANPGI